MSNYLTNKRGVALIWVLMIMLVLPILATAVLNVAVAENKFAARQGDKLQAYYIARSGAQAIAEHMLRDPGGASNLIGRTSAWNNQIGGGRFRVTVSESNQVVDVVAVGELRGLQQTASIRLTRSVPGIGGVFQHAIAARNNIDVANEAGAGIVITGSVATRDGRIDLGKHGSATSRVIDPTMIFPPIVVPTITVGNNLRAITSNITIASTAGTPRFVRADSINLGANEAISVTGNGIVHMYVYGDINLGTKAQFNVVPAARLYVYVVGTRTISLSGSGNQNNVFLYAPDSHIRWNNAQPKAEFNGAIIGSRVTLHNQLNIKYNPLLVNDVALNTSGVGPTFTGYVWVDRCLCAPVWPILGVISVVKQRTQGGMTLVEVIVSMALIALIAGVFLPLFSSALVWVFAAGDKGKAYSVAQQDMETRLATGEAINSEPLVIDFGTGTPIKVRGGLVETRQVIGQRTSRLEAFIPLVPTILISPTVRLEGSANTFISVTGSETTFDASTRVELFDKSGTVKIGSDIVRTVTNNTTATFTLPANLVNADYIIRITTVKSPQNEIVRARYTVEQPKYVAVGTNSLYISADGSHWVKRSASVGFPAVANLKAVVNNGRRYVAVGNAGLVLVSREQQPWVSLNIATENLLGVTWSAAFARFFAVGAAGGIYAAPDESSQFADSTVLLPSSWQKLSSETSTRLNDITSTTFIGGNSLLTAVGNGIILTSANGVSWSQVMLGDVTLNAVVSGITTNAGHRIVAVGNSGAVYVSSDGFSWAAFPVTNTTNLTDVAFSQGQFIAVADNGGIFTSADGEAWTSRHTAPAGLFGVHALGNDVVAVGNNRIVVYSPDSGVNWSDFSTIAGEHLTGVAGR